MNSAFDTQFSDIVRIHRQHESAICEGEVTLRKISVLFILQQVTQPHFKVFQSETSRSLLHLREVQHKCYHSALVSGNLQSDRFFNLRTFVQ
jgi:hypothetical protein